MTFPLFLIPILCGLIAQFLKPLFNREWYASLTTDGHKIPRYGGMPSAHTAFVISLATTVGYVDGLVTTSFAIASALVIFILDDALRMRIFLGRYGQALRHLAQHLPETERAHLPYLEARLGHTTPEVLAGAAIGLSVTMLVLWLI